MAEKTKLINDTELPIEVLASEIEKISRGVRKLREGRLNNTALLTLLQASTRLNRSDITKVLDALSDLEKDYLRENVRG